MQGNRATACGYAKFQPARLRACKLNESKVPLVEGRNSGYVLHIKDDSSDRNSVHGVCQVGGVKLVDAGGDGAFLSGLARGRATTL